MPEFLFESRTKNSNRKAKGGNLHYFTYDGMEQLKLWQLDTDEDALKSISEQEGSKAR